MKRFWGHKLRISKHWFHPAILAECNGSVTRVPLGYLLNKIVVTKPLHLANQNYFAPAVLYKVKKLDHSAIHLLDNGVHHTWFENKLSDNAQQNLMTNLSDQVRGVRNYGSIRCPIKSRFDSIAIDVNEAWLRIPQTRSLRFAFSFCCAFIRPTFWLSNDWYQYPICCQMLRYDNFNSKFPDVVHKCQNNYTSLIRTETCLIQAAPSI